MSLSVICRLNYWKAKSKHGIVKRGKKCFTDLVSLLHRYIPSTPLKLLWVIIVGSVPCVVNLKFK